MRGSQANGMILFLTIVAFESTALAKPVVIVNPECHATADVEKVRKIYLGKERALCDDNVVQPLDVDDNNPLRTAFLEKILAKSDAQLRQYWSRLIFTGKGTLPKNVGNDEEVKTWVARNKNAIGVIDSAHADKSVKVLLTIE